jgi:hypothetical protein
MFAPLQRLFLAAMLLSLRIEMLGLKVWARERAYHALTRYSFRSGLVAYAFDPEDEDVKAAIQAAVDEAVSGLKASNKKLLADLKKAKAGGEVDPAELERLEGEVEKLTTQLADANTKLKAATKQAETATAALTAEQGHTQKLLVENGLVAALTEAGVKDPTLLKAAAAMIRTGQKIEIAVDGETRVAKVGDKSLGEFVKAWALGDEGKTFVAAPHNNGGGAGGSGNGGGKTNPWAKDSFNLTEQGRLYSENPTQAKALAAEAGVTIQ